MCFVVLALYGVIGLAVGTLLRHQIVAVTAALVWQLAAEHFLIAALPEVERWTPWGATSGMLQLGAAGISSGTLLAAPIGGAVPRRVHRRGGGTRARRTGMTRSRGCQTLAVARTRSRPEPRALGVEVAR